MLPLGLGLSLGRGEAGTGGPGAVGKAWKAAGADPFRAVLGDCDLIEGDGKSRSSELANVDPIGDAVDSMGDGGKFAITNGFPSLPEVGIGGADLND